MVKESQGDSRTARIADRQRNDELRKAFRRTAENAGGSQDCPLLACPVGDPELACSEFVELPKGSKGT